LQQLYLACSKQLFLNGIKGIILGRAIIYKLQRRVHRDHHDLGPSVSFGVGSYSEEEMLFPQL